MERSSEDHLRRINIEMAAAETKGDKSFFDQLFAPAFAFQRASGAFDDRGMFLAGLRPGAKRTCKADSVEVTPLPDRRALVTCVVSMEMEGGLKHFHNARLFVLDATASWQLLAWANEVAGAG
jgi:hypothetical protein